MIINTGTTRKIMVMDDYVIKKCREDYKYENDKEYENYLKYKDADTKIVNDIVLYNDGIIYAKRCDTLNKLFDKESFSNDFMDELFLTNKELDEKYKYSEKRDYLMQKTKLNFEEFQVPDNWGITSEGELVLIDYSR